MLVTIVSLWAQKLFRLDEPQPFGGAELQLTLLAKALVKRFGVEVQFITRGQGPFEIFEVDGIRVYKLAYRDFPPARTILGSWDLLRLLLSLKTDIYVQRGGGIETGIVGMASRMKNKPFLFMTSHSWDVDGTHEKNRGWIYGTLYMTGLRRAAGIVTQIQNQHDLLWHNYGRESLVLPSAHEIPAPIPIKKEGVMWVSRCETWKCPHVFLRLAEALPDLRFTMVCPQANSRELFLEISQKAAALNNVTFLPGIPFEETEPLFATHRLFINTSEKEGYPNTFVQAFKWGTPVVSLHVDPDAILSTRELGVCANGDETALRNAVKQMYCDEGWWKKYSENARSYANATHNVQVIVEKFYSLLQSLKK
ncbi:MAG: glycosyltransferase [Candidatus Omnitrophota bacterium]|jgi:glycosyltransferase involved in cell wall biosynthesis|nr:MAG: glycosyltransferase [Candidatus Omnitrophota bacterium]